MPWLNAFAPRRLVAECEVCSTPMPHSPFATWSDLVLVAFGFNWEVNIRRRKVTVWCPEHQDPCGEVDSECT